MDLTSHSHAMGRRLQPMQQLLLLQGAGWVLMVCDRGHWLLPLQPASTSAPYWPGPLLPASTFQDPLMSCAKYMQCSAAGSFPGSRWFIRYEQAIHPGSHFLECYTLMFCLLDVELTLLAQTVLSSTSHESIFPIVFGGPTSTLPNIYKLPQ